MFEFEFTAFPKIARLNREVVVTEKIDGTNAQVIVSDDGTELHAASRTKLITPETDNAGFARWVQENKEDLLTLGPGSHFGEWWGSGIQRKYGLVNGEKRFSLFNTHRWGPDETRPRCCHVVPVLWSGMFQDFHPDDMIAALVRDGSAAAPGFMNPEGIVIFHTAGNHLFKKTVLKDESPKGLTT